MRSYPVNSPQAAARIVALTMIADGQVAPSEVDALDRLDAASRLGLPRPDVYEAVRALCVDMLTISPLTWADACRVDPRTLCALLGEIDDPALQRTVLEMCMAVVAADGHIADGECMVLTVAMEQWGLQHLAFAPRHEAQAEAVT